MFGTDRGRVLLVIPTPKVGHQKRRQEPRKNQEEVPKYLMLVPLEDFRSKGILWQQ